MDELEVPRAVLDAYIERPPTWGWVEHTRAIATPVVVAELRRLLHDESRPGTLAEALRDRIIELEAAVRDSA